jgi:hypothetical protein
VLGVWWLVIAVLCVAAGVALLVLDRRRRAPRPPAPPAEDLFTPDALPRRPENGS